MRHFSQHGVFLVFFSLQQEHERFHDWLQAWEHKSVEGEQVNNFLKDLHKKRWIELLQTFSRVNVEQWCGGVM